MPSSDRAPSFCRGLEGRHGPWGACVFRTPTEATETRTPVFCLHIMTQGPSLASDGFWGTLPASDRSWDSTKRRLAMRPGTGSEEPCLYVTCVLTVFVGKTLSQEGHRVQPPTNCPDGRAPSSRSKLRNEKRLRRGAESRVLARGLGLHSVPCTELSQPTDRGLWHAPPLEGNSVTLTVPLISPESGALFARRVPKPHVPKSMAPHFCRGEANGRGEAAGGEQGGAWNRVSFHPSQPQLCSRVRS